MPPTGPDNARASARRMFVNLARKQRLSRLSSCSPERTSSPSDRTLRCWQAHDSCPLCCTPGVCAAKQAGVCSEAGCGDWYAICRTSSCLDYLGDAIGGAPHTARLSSRLRLLHGFLSLITPRPTLGPTASSVSARCVEYTRLSAKQVHPISPNLAQSRPISPNLDLLSSTYGHPRLAPHPHLSAGEVVLLVVLCAGAGAYILHLVAAHWATARAEARRPALSHTALSASASLSHRL